MSKSRLRVAVALLALLPALGARTILAQQVMAPLAQYLIADRNAEIALARSAAPASVSAAAGVMVLTPQGYVSAVKGANGFLCIVERSWGSDTTDPDFWNPRIRAPICFNPQAAHTVAPFYLQKTSLVLAGRSKPQIDVALASAQDKRELPPPAPSSMCYMMSKQQYLNDRGKHWHPHLMFFAPGDATKSWGANIQGSPVMAIVDSQARLTVFMVMVDSWSDGTPGPRPK